MSYKTGFKNGRLGIGIPSGGGDGNGDPLYPLDINGDIRLTGAIVKADGTIYSSGGGVGVKGLYSVQDSNTGKYKFGVGKSNPIYTLDVSGSLNLDGDIYVNGVSLSSGESTTASQALQTGNDPSWINSVTTDLTSDILSPLNDEFDTLLEIANAVQDICNNNLVINLATTANKASPTFTGTVTAPNLNITGNFQMNGQTPTFSNWTVHSNGNDIYRPAGNVGIGTTSPSDLLTVSSSGNAAVLIDKDANTFSKIYNNGEIWLKGGDNSNQILLRTNGNNSYFLNSNVGIGATSPKSGLQVIHDQGLTISGTATTGVRTAVLRLGSPYTTDIHTIENYCAKITSTNNHTMNYGSDLRFFTHPNGQSYNGSSNQPTERMCILGNGNVGIGTTSPEFIIDLKNDSFVNGDPGPTNPKYIRFMCANGAAWPASNGTASSGGLIWKTNYGGSYTKTSAKIIAVGTGNYFRQSLAFYTNGVGDHATEATEKMRIHENGNVGIGTTSPESALHIKGTLKWDSPTLGVHIGVHNNQYAGIELVSTHDYGGWIDFLKEGDSDYKGRIRYKFDTQRFDFHSNGDSDPTMTIRNGKRVGIGTDSPERTLHLYGLRTDIVFDGINGSTNYEKHYIRKDGHYLRFRGNNDSTVLFELKNNTTGNNVCSFPSGNVGIGTTSPEANLQINQSVAFTNPYVETSQTSAIHIVPNSGSSHSAITFAFANNNKRGVGAICGSSNYGMEYIVNRSRHHYFYGSTTNVTIPQSSSYDDLIMIMRGDNKRVGIGTTSPNSMLDIKGNAVPSLRLTYHGGAYTNGTVYMKLDHWSINTYLNALSLNEESSKDIRMCMGGGNVGIRDSSPSYPLEVHGYTNAGSYTAYLNASGASTDNGNTTNLCIFGDYGIGTDYAFYITSDERIKKNIVDVPDNLALEQVRNIPCRYYEYKDDIKRGTGRTIGFIAQEVKEILPMAVTLERNFIPNKTRMLENISWEEIADGSNNVYKLTSDLQDVSGIKYQFFVSNNSTENIEHKKKIIGNADNTFTFEQQWDNVFCYGREVDDFHMLDKHKLFALNFSATQELDRQQQADKAKITELENKVATLESELAAIKAHLGI